MTRVIHFERDWIKPGRPACYARGRSFRTARDKRFVTCKRCRKALVRDTLIRAEQVKQDAKALGIDLVVGFPKADGAAMIVDLFAGGGGASLGVELALGRSPDVAVNHDPEAVRMHERNHPNTRHFCGDVWDVSPREVTGGRRVELLWASPDCTYFSRSRGGKPFRDRASASCRRALAWVIVRWAREVQPDLICLENVAEFAQWCPLGNDGRPDWTREGLTFRVWVGKMKAAGYAVEWRELRACDHGAPTTRKRLFIIARRDGLPIVWPTPSHGPGTLQAYRAAAECIDWTLPIRSIFNRKRPLADNTLARIARGLDRFVFSAAEPFIVPVSHSGDQRVQSINEPLRTITASSRAPFAVVLPTLIHSGNGERPGQAPRCYDIEQPLSTVMATGQKHALICAFAARHFGGHGNDGLSLTRPITTVTARDHHALVTASANGVHLPETRAFLTKYFGTSTGQPLQLPLGTVLSGGGKYGLITVNGRHHQIGDIAHRMLQARELYRAQGFPDSYNIDGFTNTAQIRLCGNSVAPPIAAAIVRANAQRTAVAA